MVKPEPYLKFIDYLKKSEIKYNYLYNEMFVPVEKSTESQMNIREFYDAYKETVGIVDYLNFSWGLSSGENLLLDVFAKIFRLLKENETLYLPEDINSEKPARNAVILFDEAEVAFHPEWQRQYFSAMLAFIKENICSEKTHVQLIFATHSPIILSDIPKQNIVYLKKDENGKTLVDLGQNHSETFGANIFRLYNDAFFLENGAMGVFAEEKICYLLELIDNNANEKKDEIINRINMIGDIFLRKKIETKFHQKLNIPNRMNELEQKMKQLQEEMDRLKAEGEDENG